MMQLARTLSVRSNSLTAKAVSSLRNKILSGEFRAGEFLSVPKLAAAMSMSSSPIRDALRELEGIGLVTLVPRMGASVTYLDEKRLREMLGYRQALEVYAAKEASDMRQPLDLEALHASVECLRGEEKIHRDREDLPQVFQRIAAAEADFHRTVIRAARNTFIARRFQDVQLLHHQQMRVHHVTVDLSSTVTACVGNSAEYQAIYEAIEARERRLAGEAMSRHLDLLTARILAQMSARSSIADRKILSSI